MTLKATSYAFGIGSLGAFFFSIYFFLRSKKDTGRTETQDNEYAKFFMSLGWIFALVGVSTAIKQKMNQKYDKDKMKAKNWGYAVASYACLTIIIWGSFMKTETMGLGTRQLFLLFAAVFALQTN